MIEALLQAERLLVHGMVDQAEQIYRRTLESDPRNAIAAVGLARVALERADDALAYQHACAALNIDPQNAAALRLEARLSEVLVARGEVVERPAWLVSRDAAAERHVPPAAAPVGTEPPRESEQVMLTRNPSMADHRGRMERATEKPPADVERPPTTAAPLGARRRRPRGILRRLLGG